jgi:DNA (cytosine-5)-methyltransferase 1
MRVADLFSGCGGMSSGFLGAQNEIVLAAEHWSEARRVYNANFDHQAVDIDLSDLIESVWQIKAERPQIITGGPPCQEFSPAGLRQEADRADLTRNFAEIVKAVRPLWFVMENVPAARKSRAYAAATHLFKSAGYGITEIELDASLFGVPQARKRFFAIGRLGEEDQFLLDSLLEGKGDESLTVRQYLGEELGVEFYYRHPRHWGRKAIYSIDEPAATIRSTNRPIPPKYTSHHLDAAPIEGVKPLTSAQRARIQTFGKDFQFSGYLSDMDLMIANAVPVKLAEHVALTIAKYEEESGMSDDRFRQWLQDSGYGARTAGNVISRVRRAQKLLGGRTFVDVRDALHELGKLPDFSKLTPSVRSQIKKAIELEAEYRSL